MRTYGGRCQAAGLCIGQGAGAYGLVVHRRECGVLEHMHLHVETIEGGVGQSTETRTWCDSR
jgi:hypothetical protein